MATRNAPVINKQKYDAVQVQKLADLVRIYHERGQPFDYEILVDGLKVVRRTSDPEMFYIFENFITPDTRSLEILFYKNDSNVNDKRMFTFGDYEPEDKGLSGVEVDARIQEAVDKKEKEREYARVKQEVVDLKQEVDELEKNVERLEKEKQELIDSQSPLQDFLGQAGASFVESFLKRNPQILKSIPGGDALAGLLENDSSKKTQPESNTEAEVSFQSKSESHVLSDEDKAAITFVNQLKSKFTQDEFEHVLIILQTLADDKSKIELILNHVNIKQSQS